MNRSSIALIGIEIAWYRIAQYHQVANFDRLGGKLRSIRWQTSIINTCNRYGKQSYWAAMRLHIISQCFTREGGCRLTSHSPKKAETCRSAGLLLGWSLSILSVSTDVESFSTISSELKSPRLTWSPRVCHIVANMEGSIPGEFYPFYIFKEAN